MIAGVVVDTDVASYIFKGDTRGASYSRHLEGKVSIVSFMTVAELDRWALNRGWGASKMDKLERFLQRHVIRYCDRALCIKWAEVIDHVQRKGKRIQTADAWIAATAILHGIPLVTNNSKDFASVEGLTVITELRP